jgi:chromosome segregation protein
MVREQSLNSDAGDTIARLRAELAELEEAGAGQSEKVQKAAGEASQAAAVLHDRESELSQITEDVARLAASHQSADRFFEDAQKRLTKAEAEELNAKDAVAEASTQASDAAAAYEKAHIDEAAAVEAVAQAETALAEAEARRADCLNQENSARTARSEANGVVNALQAEVSALAKLVERNRGQGDQVLDQVQVDNGYEKGFGRRVGR